MSLIDILISTEQVSIYCIINEEDKKVLFGYTTSMASHVGFLHNNLPLEVKEDRNKVQFKLIETYNKKKELYLKARVDELYKEYTDLGYTFYTAYKPLQWELYVNIEIDPRVKYNSAPRPYIKLKTSHNKRYYIKACDTLQEAEQFVSSNSIVQALRHM
jgi:hypothetical protein